MQNQNLSQRLGVLAQIAPAAARNTGSYISDAVDASRFERVAAILQVGTLAGTGTVNVRFQSNSAASTSNDSNWADINSTTCISSTFASTDNNEVGVLELRLDQNPSVGRWVRAFASVATSNGWVGSVTVVGAPAIYEPASQFNPSAVSNIVVF